MYDPYDDDYRREDDYPRIERSTGVAPFWRLLAILGMIGILGLGFICVIFAVALIGQRNNPVVVASPPAVGRVPAGGVAGGMNFNPLADDEDPADDNDPGAGGDLPFPVKREVDPRELAIPGEPPAKERGPSPRQRFIDKANDLVWKGSFNDYSVASISVSPDGRFLAVVDRSGLKAGMAGNPASMELVDENEGQIPGGQIGGMAPGGPGAAPRKRSWRLAGVPSWTSDGRMFFAATDGRLREYDINRHSLRILGCLGDSPSAFPTDPRKLVYVRSKPTAKTDIPGRSGIVDPTEIVVTDLDGLQAPRVLVGASRRNWTRVVASPDGKRLALISAMPHEKKQYLTTLQLFVFSIGADGPMPVTEPGTQLGEVAWMPDSSGLIYSRGLEGMPSDCWEEDTPWANRGIDLYQYDLATTKETRLSRGGGFLCAGVDSQGMIYYRCDMTQPNNYYAQLLKIDLKKAQKFAAGEPKTIMRGVKEWSTVVEKTFRDVQLDTVAERTPLTLELMKKLAEAFSREYGEQFKPAVPVNLKSLDRQSWEVSLLEISPNERKRFRLVLAAVHGEYLRTHHGAEWKFGEGRAEWLGDDIAEDNPFAFVINITAPAFLGADDDDDEEDVTRYVNGLANQVRAAAGRKLILCNDSRAAKAAIQALTDSDLAKGVDLLKQRKDADSLLTGLVKKNPKNHYLALQVARLLLDNQRRDAAREILKEEWEPSTLDPQRHNLLGVIALEESPRNAIDEFRKSLEGDPYFGPALLNLAQAFINAGEFPSARKCLRECVKRHPADAQGADARRRLADLHTRENGKR